MEWKDIANTNLSERQDFSVVGDQVQLEERQSGVWAGFGRTVQRWFGGNRTSLAHVFERVTVSIQQDQEADLNDIDQLLKVRTVVQQRSNKFSRMNWFARLLGGHGDVTGSCAQLLKATDLKIFNLLSGKKLTLQEFSAEQQKKVTDMATFLRSPAPTLEECEYFQQELRELCPEEVEKEAFATERLQELSKAGFSGAKFEQIRLFLVDDFQESKESSYQLSCILLQEPRTIDDATLKSFVELMNDKVGDQYIFKMAENGYPIAQYVASFNDRIPSDNKHDLWLSEAAIAGIPAAQYRLAKKIDAGNLSIEVPKGITSISLKEKAALLGHREAILDIGRRLSLVVSQSEHGVRSQYYQEKYTLKPVTVRQLLHEVICGPDELDVEAALVFGKLCAGNVDVRVPEQSPIIARYADQEQYADLWFGSIAERFLDERRVLKLSGADEEGLKLHAAGFVLKHGLFGLDPALEVANRIYESVETPVVPADDSSSEPTMRSTNSSGDINEVLGGQEVFSDGSSERDAGDSNDFESNFSYAGSSGYGVDALPEQEDAGNLTVNEEEEDSELFAAIAASLADMSHWGFDAGDIAQAEDLSQQESHVDSLEREFIQSLLLEQELVIRATPDDGDCLFAACLAENDERTPADIRKAVYGLMTQKSKEFGFAIYNDLVAEAEEYRKASNEAERVRIISKLPPTFVKKLSEMDPTQEAGELLWPWYEDSSAEGMVQSYLKEMAEDKYYAGQVEWLALSQVIGKPLRIYSRAIGEPQNIPWDAAYGREEFVHLYYDSRHRHYERLIPTTA